jgi:hypothetical protein
MVYLQYVGYCRNAFQGLVETREELLVECLVAPPLQMSYNRVAAQYTVASSYLQCSRFMNF